ncbi:MAG: VWA domain-containing protein, partial [Gemmatimonadota bacterium]|nr:VWA domain-containing protein [Gemmatimonadota bacterium]
DPLPRSLTFVIDISSSMQEGKLKAVKGALAAAIDALDAADLFNIVVFTHRADSFAAAPVPADPDNKKAATAFINQQDALGVSNFEAGLGRAMQQAFPANRVNHVIFLTDGLPTLGELGLESLSELIGEWSAGQARLFTIGVGRDVDQGFLRGLAEDHRGEAYFLSEEGDIEAALQDLFESFTFPILLLDELSFDQVEIHDIHPRGVEALAAGRELFQVGRYRGGGTFTLSLTGHVGEENVSVDFPLEFTQTDVSGSLIPRLWAYQKIQALEEQIARFGEQQELLDDILALGLEYRLVTRRTSLFAPDDGVEVNPQPRDEELAFDSDFFDGGATTDINDARPTTHWLGRDFAFQDEVWIDTAYHPGMPKELYEGRTYQPAELANFARLGQAMLVVVAERAYEIPANAQGSRPVLLQNAPNPFNASTTISFLIPFRLANEATRLSIYNLTGQLVRVLQLETLQAGEHTLSWDGRDDYGREVASGVYIYRLDVGEWAVHRRMLLLR